MENRLPFSISKTENFFDRLGEYVGDVFYDILPELGFELRDEQIYMAYQIEQAFKNKSVIFAEAGVGTGKTLVYLLYAICYARYKGKPAIIACADETLIEQLVKEGGDIEKLEKALSLSIDVRLAKAREQYVCVRKLDALVDQTDDPDILRVHDTIPEFVFDQGVSMNAFERYGDRKEYPWVSNEKWALESTWTLKNRGIYKRHWIVWVLQEPDKQLQIHGRYLEDLLQRYLKSTFFLTREDMRFVRLK